MDRAALQPLVASVVERIAEAVRPKKIVLFGSRGRGDDLDGSDIDLLIVHAGPEPKRDLKLRIRRLFPRQRFAMDLLVLTPGEYRRQLGIANSAARIAEREGVLCHG